jgi:hypothetical protein
MSWKRWNWLDSGVLPLTLAVLRVCWLWPWLALLQRWVAFSYEGTLLPLGAVLGLLLGGAVAARWALTLTAIRARAAVAVIGLLVVFMMLWWRLYRVQYGLWDLRWVAAWGNEMTTWTDWETRGVPTPVFMLLAMAYLWLRGVLDGGRLSVMREHVWRTFVAGFIALALLLLVAPVDGGGLPEGTGNLLWLFFATAMVALALTGLKAAGGLDNIVGTEEEGDARPRFDRYWLGSVVSVITGLLGVALMLSALIAPDAAAQVLRAVWIVVRQGILYLWILISLVIYPIAYLLALALRPVLDRLVEFIGPDGLFGLKLPEAPRPEELRKGEAAGAFDSMPDELRWVALVVLIVVIGLAFAFALRRLLSGAKARNGIVETRETVLSRDLLQEQLTKLWQSLVDRLRRASKAAVSPFLSLEGELATRRVIRAVYQTLLANAQERGLSRLRGQTPIEYRRELVKSWSTNREALDVITDGYVQARYASDPPSAEQAEFVSQAWENVQESLESGYTASSGARE